MPEKQGIIKALFMKCYQPKEKRNNRSGTKIKWNKQRI